MRWVTLLSVTAAISATAATASQADPPPVVPVVSPLVVPAVVVVPERFQGRDIRWWAAKTVRARKEANALKAEVKRLRARLARHLQASDLSAWTCIHRGEGAWNSATGNGYFGGLQMDYSFMRSYGPEMLASKGTADHWTPAEQIMVARRARDSGRGYDPWPKTARACGLR